jgi:site-specific DNA-methyltransferase (adenine-specific)
MEVHYSSASDEWATPAEFFAQLQSEFAFTLDPCATRTNAKAERYFTRATDGLAQAWEGSVFMNPPYGSAIGKWVAKAYRESRRGALIVCLIPARTDTRYWHDYVMRADELRFVRGRIRFEGGAYSAPFPSVLVIFRSTSEGPPRVAATPR